MTDEPRYRTCLGCGARALPEQMDGDLCSHCFNRLNRTDRWWWR